MPLKFSKNEVAFSPGFGELATPIPVPGETPEFTVGEVVTLEPGEKAWVKIDNTDLENPVISFGIPRGEDGSGGADTSFVIGEEKPESPCIWFNTSLDEEGEVEPDPDPVKYTVTYNLTNCDTRDGANCEVVEGSEYQDTIYAIDGYVLDTVTVTMGGSAVTVTDGVFYIASVTGNIVITATATEAEETTKYTVTLDNTHDGIVFVQGRPPEVEEGGTLYSQIAAQSGGNFSINITMGGVDITDTAYTDDSSGSSASSNYGTIRVNNVNGDIVITIRPV